MQAKMTEKKYVFHYSLNLESQQMEQFSLLSREAELALVKKIEEHRREILLTATRFPDSLNIIHAHFKQVLSGELRLNTLIYGFVLGKSPMANQDFNLKTLEKKFFDLSVLQCWVRERREQLGQQHRLTLEAQEALARYLSTFKWNPAIIEKLVDRLQSLADDLSPVEAKALKAKLVLDLKEMKTAKQQLINANLRLVFSIAKKYHYPGLQYLDLIQEGSLALAQAVDEFEYCFGSRIANYAVHWISAAILNFISRNQLLKIPNHDLADKAAASTEVVSAKKLSELTREALASLTLREATVLCLRFGIGIEAEYGLEEISQQLGLSKERIRRIEAKALKTLLQKQSLNLNPL